MSLLEVCFICCRHYENILSIVSIFIFFVLCFFRFYGNAPLKHCFEFLYQENTYFSLYYLAVKKNIFNFDKSKLFWINSIPIVLLAINHIQILPLNNHLFNNIDIIKNFDKTSWIIQSDYFKIIQNNSKSILKINQVIAEFCFCKKNIPHLMMKIFGRMTSMYLSFTHMVPLTPVASLLLFLEMSSQHL